MPARKRPGAKNKHKPPLPTAPKSAAISPKSPALPPTLFRDRIQAGFITFGPEVRVTPYALKAATTTFPIEILDIVASLASQGKSIRSICHQIGIAFTTWYEWQKTGVFPQLFEAYDVGRAAEEDTLVETLYRHAERWAPAAMFLLKSRFAYREGEAVGGQGRSGVTVNISLPGAPTASEYRRATAKIVNQLPEGAGDD